MGNNTFIGSGAVIIQNIKIEKSCFIKAKKLILKNVTSKKT